MSTNWKAGDKALCVDDRICPTWNPEVTIDFDLIQKGKIYLVDAFRDVEFSDGRFPRLFIVGLSIKMVGVGECGFNPSRFRKIVPACDRATNQEEGLVPHEGFWEGRQ